VLIDFLSFWTQLEEIPSEVASHGE
jgi:hypothetical protein